MDALVARLLAEEEETGFAPTSPHIEVAGQGIPSPVQSDSPASIVQSHDVPSTQTESTHTTGHDTQLEEESPSIPAHIPPTANSAVSQEPSSDVADREAAERERIFSEQQRVNRLIQQLREKHDFLCDLDEQIGELQTQHQNRPPSPPTAKRIEGLCWRRSELTNEIARLTVDMQCREGARETAVDQLAEDLALLKIRLSGLPSHDELLFTMKRLHEALYDLDELCEHPEQRENPKYLERRTRIVNAIGHTTDLLQKTVPSENANAEISEKQAESVSSSPAQGSNSLSSPSQPFNVPIQTTSNLENEYFLSSPPKELARISTPCSPTPIALLPEFAPVSMEDTDVNPFGSESEDSDTGPRTHHTTMFVGSRQSTLSSGFHGSSANPFGLDAEDSDEKYQYIEPSVTRAHFSDPEPSNADPINPHPTQPAEPTHLSPSHSPDERHGMVQSQTDPWSSHDTVHIPRSVSGLANTGSMEVAPPTTRASVPLHGPSVVPAVQHVSHVSGSSWGQEVDEGPVEKWAESGLSEDGQVGEGIAPVSEKGEAHQRFPWASPLAQTDEVSVDVGPGPIGARLSGRLEVITFVPLSEGRVSPLKGRVPVGGRLVRVDGKSVSDFTFEDVQKLFIVTSNRPRRTLTFHCPQGQRERLLGSIQSTVIGTVETARDALGDVAQRVASVRQTHPQSGQTGTKPRSSSGDLVQSYINFFS